MPISIVVGGQYGSEGKGKVAYHLARRHHARAALRVGGPNSGHTIIDETGSTQIFRQLPTAVALPETICLLPAGTYIDRAVLGDEIRRTGILKSRLKIDPRAVIITPECISREAAGDLRYRVGSTMTGTGGAVVMRAERSPNLRFARDEPELVEFLADVAEFIEFACAKGDRVVAEGSQGFGLSVLHTECYPFATSRDTTAAAVLSEIGLSPMLVDEIALVLRAFPIRVPGNSGPLANETTWESIAHEGGYADTFQELTSVTRAVRRVARFEDSIVRAAIRANQPTSIYLNHVDYVDRMAFVTGKQTHKTRDFVETISARIGRDVDYIGLGPADCLPTN